MIYKIVYKIGKENTSTHKHAQAQTTNYNCKCYELLVIKGVVSIF